MCDWERRLFEQMHQILGQLSPYHDWFQYYTILYNIYVLWFIMLICNKLLSNNCSPHISAHTGKTGKGTALISPENSHRGKSESELQRGTWAKDFPIMIASTRICAVMELNPTPHFITSFSFQPPCWSTIQKISEQISTTGDLYEGSVQHFLYTIIYLHPERMRKMQAHDHCRAFLGETTGWRRLATWLPWHWVGDCSELNLSYGGSV